MQKALARPLIIPSYTFCRDTEGQWPGQGTEPKYNSESAKLRRKEKGGVLTSKPDATEVLKAVPRQ